MMRKNAVKALSALAVVLIVITFSIIILPSDIAYAVLPEHYVADVTDKSLDWWSSDKYLDINTLKHTVDSWKADESYDFDYLKENPVVIAVIDSGIDLSHEIFLGKYDVNGHYDTGAVDKNGVGKCDVLLRDAEGNAVIKNTYGSAYYDENDVTDDAKNRHGTHVAGIAAILIHLLDLEEYVKILPIKASRMDSFTGESVKSALEFAISKGADVVNMSLSAERESFAGIKYSDAQEKAILVAAAGNNGLRTKRYPAALPNVIGVMNYEQAADDGEIKLSGTSNYGTWTSGTTVTGYDVCAPGDKIFSARGGGDTSEDIGENYSEYYKSLSGTSMASPVVAFGAALITLKYHALAGSGVKQKSPVELADLVRNASTSTLNKAGVDYKIFDINALVGVAWHEAEISLENGSVAHQRLGSISKISFKLNVLPKGEYGKGTVSWYADDVKIGEGFEIEYTPAAEVGTMDIKAVWEHSDTIGGVQSVVECTTQVTVDYVVITADSVAEFKIFAFCNGSAVDNLSLGEIGKTYTFKVADAVNIAPENSAATKWIVNDELKYVGSDFEFTPEEYGEYRIKVKINGFSSGEILLNVAENKTDGEHKHELYIYTIVTAVVIGVAVIAVIGVVLAKHTAKSKKR